MTNTTNSNIEPVTTAQIPAYVSDAHALRLPLFIWGSPGVGKSAAVAQAADHLDLGFIDIRLSQIDSVDLRGLPHVDRDTNRSRYALPDVLPFAERDGKNGILFLDEMNLASAATQSAAYQLIHDRKLGDYILPEGWTVIAAGNERSHRVHATKMSSALANRFTHLWTTTDLDGWSRWAARAGIADIIRAFIRNRPELLNTFDPAKEETAFATPRSLGKSEQNSRSRAQGAPMAAYRRQRRSRARR
jgi:MoxR-like ATPase